MENNQFIYFKYFNSKSYLSLRTVLADFKKVGEKKKKVFEPIATINNTNYYAHGARMLAKCVHGVS